MTRSRPRARRAAEALSCAALGLAVLLASGPARADQLCVVEAAAPAPVHEFEGGAEIGALPPGMPVVVTDRTFLDEAGRPWVFAQSFEQVAGWIADEAVRCR